MNNDDLKYIRYANKIALRARNRGNHPFGALLVDDQGNVLLEGENTQVTDRDITGHAETNLMREACRKYSADLLSTVHIVRKHRTLPNVYRSHILGEC